MKSLKGKYIKSDAKINRANLQKWVKWFATIFFLSGMIMAANAQEAIPASGGTVNGQGGSVSFTVGQVVYTTDSSQEHTISRGVQQPYEISVVTSSSEITLTGIDVQAYPNPATDFLTLRIEAVQNKNVQSLVCELFDMNGRMLEKQNITSSHTNIRMSHLAASSYLLKVYNAPDISSSGQNSSVQSKTFKIIKK